MSCATKALEVHQANSAATGCPCVPSVSDLQNQLNHVQKEQREYHSAVIGMEGERSAWFASVRADLNHKISSIQRMVGATDEDETARLSYLSQLQQHLVEFDSEAKKHVDESSATTGSIIQQYAQKIGELETQIQTVWWQNWHTEQTKAENNSSRGDNGRIPGDIIPHLPADIYAIEIEPTAYDASIEFLKAQTPDAIADMMQTAIQRRETLSEQRSDLDQAIRDSSSIHGPKSAHAQSLVEQDFVLLGSLTRADVEISLIGDFVG